MKLHRFFPLIIAALSIGFVSCSDDDEPAVINADGSITLNYTVEYDNVPYLYATQVLDGTEEPSGIQGVQSQDVNSPVEYYNIQGMKVSNPVAGGIYIVRQGAKVSKQLVK